VEDKESMACGVPAYQKDKGIEIGFARQKKECHPFLLPGSPGQV
jgi:hypothetical protein